MPTVAPSQEAQEAIVAYINGETFSVPFTAIATDVARTELDDGEWLCVDVVHDGEEQLYETLDASDDNTRHRILVQITGRRKPDGLDSTADLKLLARQIFDSLDQWDSDDGRVQVWFCDREPVSVTDKDALRTLGLFRRNILCEVEVIA